MKYLLSDFNVIAENTPEGVIQKPDMTLSEELMIEFFKTSHYEDWSDYFRDVPLPTDFSHPFYLDLLTKTKRLNFQNHQDVKDDYIQEVKYNREQGYIPTISHPFPFTVMETLDRLRKIRDSLQIGTGL